MYLCFFRIKTKKSQFHSLKWTVVLLREESGRRASNQRWGEESKVLLPYRFSRGPLVVGGLRSCGTNTLGLRGRHKYTLRQGPLDRRGGGRVEGGGGGESAAVMMCCRLAGRRCGSWAVHQEDEGEGGSDAQFFFGTILSAQTAASIAFCLS